MILTGSNGKAYAYDQVQKKVLYDEKIHGKPILCLDTYPPLNVFATGSCDGSVLVYRWNAETCLFEVLKDFSLRDNSSNELILSESSYVQSVSLGELSENNIGKVACGLRDGSILEFIMDERPEINFSRVATYIDNERTISLCFDHTSTKLFSVSYEGTLCIWDVYSSPRLIHLEKLNEICLKVYKF